MTQSKYHSRLYQSTRVKIKLKASPFNSKIRIFAMAKTPADVIKGLNPRGNPRNYKSKQSPIIEDISSISNAFSHLHNDVETLLDKNTEEAKDAEIHDSELFKALLPLSQKYSRSQFFNDRIKNDLQRNRSSNDLFSTRKRHHRQRFTYDGPERSLVSPKPRHFSPNARYKRTIPLKLNNQRARRRSSITRSSLPVISLNHPRSNSVSDFNAKKSSSPQSNKSLHGSPVSRIPNNQDIPDLESRSILFDSKSKNANQEAQKKSNQSFPNENNQQNNDRKVIFDIDNNPTEKTQTTIKNDSKSPNKNSKKEQNKSQLNPSNSKSAASPKRRPTNQNDDKESIQNDKLNKSDKTNDQQQQKLSSKEVDLEDDKEKSGKLQKDAQKEGDALGAKLKEDEKKKAEKEEEAKKLAEKGKQSEAKELAEKEAELLAENERQKEAEQLASNEQQKEAELISENERQKEAELLAEKEKQKEAELLAEKEKEKEKIDVLNMTEFNDSCFLENEDLNSPLFVCTPYSSFLSVKAFSNQDSKTQKSQDDKDQTGQDDKSQTKDDKPSIIPLDDDELLKTDFNTSNFIYEPKDQMFKPSSLFEDRGLLNNEFSTINFTSEAKEKSNCSAGESFNVSSQKVNFFNKEASLKNKKKNVKKSSIKSENEHDLIKFDQSIQLDDSNRIIDGYERDQLNSYNLLLFKQDEFVIPQQIGKNDSPYNNFLREIENDSMSTIPTLFNALQISDFPSKTSQNEEDEEENNENEQIFDDEKRRNFLFQDRSANLLFGNSSKLFGFTNDFGDSVQTNVNEISMINEDAENIANRRERSISSFEYILPTINDSMFLPLTFLNESKPMIYDENGPLNQSQSSFQLTNEDLNNKDDFLVSCKDCEKEKMINDYKIENSSFVNKSSSFVCQQKRSEYRIKTLDYSFVDLLQTASKFIDKSFNNNDDFECKQTYKFVDKNWVENDFECKQTSKFIDDSLYNDFKLPKSVNIDYVNDDFRSELSSNNIIQNDDFEILKPSQFIDDNCNRDFELPKTGEYTDYSTYNDDFEPKLSSQVIQNDDFQTQRSTQFIDHLCYSDFALSRYDKHIDNTAFNNNNNEFKSQLSSNRVKLDDFKVKRPSKFIDDNCSKDFELQKTAKIIVNDDDFACKQTSNYTDLGNYNKDFTLPKTDDMFIDKRVSGNEFDIRQATRIIAKDRFNDDFTCQKLPERIIIDNDFELPKLSRFVDTFFDKNDFEIPKSKAIQFSDDFTCQQTSKVIEDNDDLFQCQQSPEVNQQDCMQICNLDTVKDEYKVNIEEMTITCDNEIKEVNKESFTITNDNENNKPTDFVINSSDYHEEEKPRSLISESKEASSTISRNANNYTDTVKFYLFSNDDFQYNEFNAINETEYDQFLPTMNDKCFQSVSFLSTPFTSDFIVKETPESSKLNSQVFNDDDFDLSSSKTTENNKIFNNDDFNLHQNDKIISTVQKNSFISDLSEGIDKKSIEKNEFKISDSPSYKEKSGKFTIEDSVYDSSMFLDMKIDNRNSYKEENHLLNDNFYTQSLCSNPTIQETSFLSEIKNESVINDDFCTPLFNETSFSANRQEFDLSINKKYTDDAEINFTCESDSYKDETQQQFNETDFNYVDNQNLSEFLTIQSSDKLFVTEETIVNNNYNNNDYSIPSSFYNIANMIENRCIYNSNEHLFRLPRVKDAHLDTSNKMSTTDKGNLKSIISSYSSIDISMNNSKLPKENEFNDSDVNKLKDNASSPVLEKGEYKEREKTFNVDKSKYKEPKDSKQVLKPNNFTNKSKLVVNKKENYIDNEKYNDMTSPVDTKDYKDSKSPRQYVKTSNYKDLKSSNLVVKPNNYTNSSSLIIDEDDIHFVVKCNEMNCIIDDKNYKGNDVSKKILKPNNFTNRSKLVVDKKEKYLVDKKDEMTSNVDTKDYKESDESKHSLEQNNYKDPKFSKLVIRPNNYTNSSPSEQILKDNNNYNQTSKSKPVSKQENYKEKETSKNISNPENYKDSNASKNVAKDNNYKDSTKQKLLSKHDKYKDPNEANLASKDEDYKDSKSSKFLLKPSNYKESESSKVAEKDDNYKESETSKNVSKPESYKVSNSPKQIQQESNYKSSATQKSVVKGDNYRNSGSPKNVSKENNYKNLASSKNVRKDDYKDSDTLNNVLKEDDYKNDDGSMNVFEDENYTNSESLKNVLNDDDYKNSNSLKKVLNDDNYKNNSSSKNVSKGEKYKNKDSPMNVLNDDDYKNSNSLKNVQNDENYRNSSGPKTVSKGEKYKNKDNSKNVLNDDDYKNSNSLKNVLNDENYKNASSSKTVSKCDKYKNNGSSKNVLNDRNYKNSGSSKNISKGEKYKNNDSSKNVLNDDEYKNSNSLKNVLNDEYRNSNSSMNVLKDEEYKNSSGSMNALKDENYRNSSGSMNVLKDENYRNSSGSMNVLKDEEYRNSNSPMNILKDENYRNSSGSMNVLNDDEYKNSAISNNILDEDENYANSDTMKNVLNNEEYRESNPPEVVTRGVDYKEAGSPRLVTDKDSKYTNSSTPKRVAKPNNYTEQSSLNVEDDEKFAVDDYSEMTCFISTKNYKDKSPSKHVLKDNNYRDTNQSKRVLKQNNYKVLSPSNRIAKDNNYKDSTSSRHLLKDDNYKDSSPSRHVLKDNDYRDSSLSRSVLEDNDYKDSKPTKLVLKQGNYRDLNRSSHALKDNNYRGLSPTGHVSQDNDYRDMSHSNFNNMSSLAIDEDDKYLANNYSDMTCFTNKYRDMSPSKRILSSGKYVNSSSFNINPSNKSMFNRYNDMMCFIDNNYYDCKHSAPSLPESFTCSFSLLRNNESPDSSKSLIKESNFEPLNTDDLTASDFSSMSTIDRSIYSFNNPSIMNMSDFNQIDSFDNFSLKLPSNNDKQFGQLSFKYEPYSSFTNELLRPRIDKEIPVSVSSNHLDSAEKADFLIQNQNVLKQDKNIPNMEFSLDPNEFRSISVFDIIKESNESKKIDQQPANQPSLSSNKCIINDNEFNLLVDQEQQFVNPTSSLSIKKDSHQLLSMNDFKCQKSIIEDRGFDFDINGIYIEEEEEELSESNDEATEINISIISTKRENRRFQSNLPTMNDSMFNLKFICEEGKFISNIMKDDNIVPEGSNWTDKTTSYKDKEESYKVSNPFDKIMNDSSFKSVSFSCPMKVKSVTSIVPCDKKIKSVPNLTINPVIDDILINETEFKVSNIDDSQDLDEIFNYQKSEYHISSNDTEFNSVSLYVDPTSLKALPSLSALSKEAQRSPSKSSMNEKQLNLSDYSTSSFMICRSVFLINNENDNEDQPDESTDAETSEEALLFRNIENGFMLSDRIFGPLKFECPMKPMKAESSSYIEECNEEDTKLQTQVKMPTIIPIDVADSINFDNETNQDKFTSSTTTFSNYGTRMISEETKAKIPQVNYKELPSVHEIGKLEEIKSKDILSSDMTIINNAGSESILAKDKKVQFIEEVFDENEFLVYSPMNTSNVKSSSFVSRIQNPDKTVCSPSYIDLCNEERIRTNDMNSFSSIAKQTNESKSTFLSSVSSFVTNPLLARIRANDMNCLSIFSKKTDENKSALISSASSFVMDPLNARVPQNSMLSADNTKKNSEEEMKTNENAQIRANEMNSLSPISKKTDENKSELISSVSSFVMDPLHARVPQNSMLSEDNAKMNSEEEMKTNENAQIRANEMNCLSPIAKKTNENKSALIFSVSSFVTDPLLARVPQNSMLSIGNVNANSEEGLKTNENASILSSDYFKSLTSSYIENNTLKNKSGFTVNNCTFTISKISSNISRETFDEIERIPSKSLEEGENASKVDIIFLNVSGSSYKCPSDPFSNNFNCISSSLLSKSLNLSTTFDNNNNNKSTSVVESAIKSVSFDNQEFFTISAIFPEKSTFMEDANNQSFGLLNSSADFIVNRVNDRQQSNDSATKTVINMSSLLISNSNYNISLPHSPAFSQLDEFKPYVIPRDPDKELVKGKRKRRDPNFEKFDVTIFGKNNAFISYVNDNNKQDEDSSSKTTKIDSSFLNVPKGATAQIKPQTDNNEATESEDNEKKSKEKEEDISYDILEYSEQEKLNPSQKKKTTKNEKENESLFENEYNYESENSIDMPNDKNNNKLNLLSEDTESNHSNAIDRKVKNNQTNQKESNDEKLPKIEEEEEETSEQSQVFQEDEETSEQKQQQSTPEETVQKSPTSESPNKEKTENESENDKVAMSDDWHLSSLSTEPEEKEKENTVDLPEEDKSKQEKVEDESSQHKEDSEEIEPIKEDKTKQEQESETKDDDQESKTKKLAELEKEKQEAEKLAELRKEKQEAENKAKKLAELEKEKQEAENKAKKLAEIEKEKQEAESKAKRLAEIEKEKQEAENKAKRLAELEKDKQEAENKAKKLAELEKEKQKTKEEKLAKDEKINKDKDQRHRLPMDKEQSENEEAKDRNLSPESGKATKDEAKAQNKASPADKSNDAKAADKEKEDFQSASSSIHPSEKESVKSENENEIESSEKSEDIKPRRRHRTQKKQPTEDNEEANKQQQEDQLLNKKNLQQQEIEKSRENDQKVSNLSPAQKEAKDPNKERSDNEIGSPDQNENDDENQQPRKKRRSRKKQFKDSNIFNFGSAENENEYEYNNSPQKEEGNNKEEGNEDGNNQEFPKFLPTLRRPKKKVQNNQAESKESENGNSEEAQQTKKKRRSRRKQIKDENAFDLDQEEKGKENESEDEDSQKNNNASPNTKQQKLEPTTKDSQNIANLSPTSKQQKKGEGIDDGIVKQIISSSSNKEKANSETDDSQRTSENENENQEHRPRRRLKSRRKQNKEPNIFDFDENDNEDEDRNNNNKEEENKNLDDSYPSKRKHNKPLTKKHFKDSNILNFGPPQAENDNEKDETVLQIIEIDSIKQTKGNETDHVEIEKETIDQTITSDTTKIRKKKKVVKTVKTHKENPNDQEDQNENENEPTTSDEESKKGKQSSRPKRKRKPKTQKENEEENNLQGLIQNVENDLPNFSLNQIDNPAPNKSMPHDIYLNFELLRKTVNDNNSPKPPPSREFSKTQPAPHIEVPTVRHTEPAPPLPLPKIPPNTSEEEEELEYDGDHNLITVTLNPKNVKFNKKSNQNSESQQNWPNLNEDYYQRNGKGHEKGGKKKGRRQRLRKDLDDQINTESRIDSLHHFIMSPLHNLQLMSPTRSEKFMRQLSTNEFQSISLPPLKSGEKIDYSIFFESIIFPISIQNEDVAKMIKPNMTFNECLLLAEQFIDDRLLPLKSNSIVFQQHLDDQGNFFSITLNGLIQTKNNFFEPVPINEVSFKINDKSRSRSKSKAKSKTVSVSVNVGNEKYVISTNDPQPLVSLLDHQSYGVLSVLKKSEIEYDNRNRDIFGVKISNTSQPSIHDDIESSDEKSFIQTSVIISPNLLVSISLLNSPHFPLKLVKKLFDSMIVLKYHIYITRALFLAEAANVPSHLIFKRSSRHSRPLMLIFIAYGIKWIRNLISSLVKVKEIEIGRFLKLVLKALSKLPEESFFIIRTIVTLSFFTVGNGKSVFNLFLSFLSRVIREVVKVTKNEEEIDYNGDVMSNSQIIESIQLLFSNLLLQLENMDKSSDSSFVILIPFLSEILSKTPELNEKKKAVDLEEVKSFIENHEKEIEFDLMKFVDQPKSKSILSYSFAFNFQFLSELAD